MEPLLRSTSLVAELADETAVCLARYGLIPPGARVAVALSGGVDSWAALALLRWLIDAGRLNARLTALHVDLGHPGAPERRAAVERGCAAADVPLAIRETTIGPRSVADGGARPCFLCARARRQVVFELAHEVGADRIATGHHRDDALATFVLNLLENREVSTLTPCRPAFDGRFTLIRPLYAIPKARIEKLHRQQTLPVVGSGCPVDGATRRQTATEFLAWTETKFPGAAEALFAALHRVKPEFFPRDVS